MADLYPEIDITSDQAEAMARGLYVVAKADGTIHPSEAALIADFFGAATGNVAALATLERTPIDGAALAAHLPTEEHRTVFLKTAVLLAYADGSYGGGESKVIADFAKALGLNAKLAQLEGEVKDYLLSSLSHVKNVDATMKVAKEMKL